MIAPTSKQAALDLVAQIIVRALDRVETDNAVRSESAVGSRVAA